MHTGQIYVYIMAVVLKLRGPKMDPGGTPSHFLKYRNVSSQERQNMKLLCSELQSSVLEPAAVHPLLWEICSHTLVTRSWPWICVRLSEGITHGQQNVSTLTRVWVTWGTSCPPDTCKATIQLEILGHGFWGWMIMTRWCGFLSLVACCQTFLRCHPITLRRHWWVYKWTRDVSV